MQTLDKHIPTPTKRSNTSKAHFAQIRCTNSKASHPVPTQNWITHWWDSEETGPREKKNLLKRSTIVRHHLTHVFALSCVNFPLLSQDSQRTPVLVKGKEASNTGAEKSVRKGLELQVMVISHNQHSPSCQPDHHANHSNLPSFRVMWFLVSAVWGSMSTKKRTRRSKTSILVTGIFSAARRFWKMFSAKRAPDFSEALLSVNKNRGKLATSMSGAHLADQVIKMCTRLCINCGLHVTRVNPKTRRHTANLFFCMSEKHCTRQLTHWPWSYACPIA